MMADEARLTTAGCTAMPLSVMTIPEVARLLRVSEKKTYRLAKSGELPSFRLGSAWRFRRSDVESWVAAQVRGRTKKKVRAWP